MNIKTIFLLMLSFISSYLYASCNEASRMALSKDCLQPSCVAITYNTDRGDLALTGYQLKAQGWLGDSQKEGDTLIVNPAETDSLYVCGDETLTISLATTTKRPNADPKKKDENAINYCGVFRYSTDQDAHITVTPIGYRGGYPESYRYYADVKFGLNSMNMLGYFTGTKYPAICTPVSH